MPTYEYACRACGHAFEVVQSMKDESLKECPECGGELRKVFAPPMITFRGSGFYATDHRKRGEGSADKDTSDAGSRQERGDKDRKEPSSRAEGEQKGSEKTGSEHGSADRKTASPSSEGDSTTKRAPAKKDARS
jgi:putative FmdB family regulatory protein